MLNYLPQEYCSTIYCLESQITSTQYYLYVQIQNIINYSRVLRINITIQMYCIFFNPPFLNNTYCYNRNNVMFSRFISITG